MRKTTLKAFAMSALMIFAGWQSFAGIASVDSVYALASNKIQFTIPTGTLSSGDSVGWFLGTTAITSGSGYSFVSTPGYKNNTLRIDGATATDFQQPSDSLTASTYSIYVVIYSEGGCISNDTSQYQVLVLPYLKPMKVDWTDSGALCANNSINDSLTATKPALTGIASWPRVSINDITWWEENVTTPSGPTQINNGGGYTITTSGNTSTLSFMTPLNTDEYHYHAEATYDLGGNTLIVSATPGTDDGHATSNNVKIQATAAPTAPALNGSVQGW